jgi:glycosyltransferase involved in cell wall biosynthesis
MTSATQPVLTPETGERRRQTSPEVSVVMPCLNEAACVAECVTQALNTLERCGVTGEVIVCDNGSTDGSALLATAAGATVVYEEQRGYGSAYLRALREARGRYIVMGDADGTYDFTLIPDFLEPLRHGYDLVMGSRQMSGSDSPFLHRYVGVPVLTGFLNIVAGGKVSDAHCGMRAFTREAIDRLDLSTTGMEFASEMIVKAIRARMSIAEIPIPYNVRTGESKLRTFRDGWRHLRFLLLESPTFLFVIPGLSMMLLGILALAVLTPGRLYLGSLSFDFHYMVVAALLSILGWQVLTLGLFAKVISVRQGSCRPDKFVSRFISIFNLEKTLACSIAAAGAGLGLLVWVVVSWVQQGFGFDEGIMLRPALFGMTLVVIGVGSAFSAFFLSALMLERSGSGSFKRRLLDSTPGMVSELGTG